MNRKFDDFKFDDFKFVPGGQTNSLIEHAAGILSKCAAAAPYTGPFSNEDTIMGWPVSKAMDQVGMPIEMRAAVHRELNRRYGITPMNNTPKPPRPFTHNEMMAARMRWGTFGEASKWAPGFQHVAIQQTGNKVHIWVITKDGQSIVIEDDEPLYPSDATITKLRLLQSGE